MHTVINGICDVCGKKFESDKKQPDLNMDNNSSLGVVPDSDFEENNDNNNNNNFESETGDCTEIPETGSGSDIVCVLIIVSMGFISLMLGLYFGKKKLTE